MFAKAIAIGESNLELFYSAYVRTHREPELTVPAGTALAKSVHTR